MYNVVKNFPGDHSSNTEYREWLKQAYALLDTMYGEHDHILGNLATHPVHSYYLEKLAGWGLELDDANRIISAAWQSYTKYSHYRMQLYDSIHTSVCGMQVSFSFVSDVDAVYFKLAMS